MLGSVAIAVNSLTGPAMLTLPATFARSGLIPTIFVLVFVCILSALCSLHTANIISKVPGNKNFSMEVEFSEVFGIFWGKSWFVVSQVLFFGCVTCLNISSIVDTAQVIDTFLSHWMPFGGTAAVAFGDEGIDLVLWDYSVCSVEELQAGDCTPFAGDDRLLFTAGKLVVTALFLPLSLMDLKENAVWQIVGFLILLIVSLQFVVQFASSPGLSLDNITLWGDTWTDLFGIVLFNFSLVIAIPAWLYEKEPHVDVPTVVHGSSILSVALYISIGLLGCLAMPNVSENMLESMMSGAYGTSLQLGASLFAFVIIGLGIPLFSVLVRLNLSSKGTCSEWTSKVLAVYLPFAASWFFGNGSAVTKLLSWGGVIFTGLVAFILPLVLALYTTTYQDEDNPGYIAVYGSWFQDKASHATSLRALLVLVVLSVMVALGGNVWDTATSGHIM